MSDKEKVNYLAAAWLNLAQHYAATINPTIAQHTGSCACKPCMCARRILRLEDPRVIDLADLRKTNTPTLDAPNQDRKKTKRRKRNGSL